MKHHPLCIETLHEPHGGGSGETLAYVSKGRHTATDFAAEMDAAGWGAIDPRHVRHVCMRVVPQDGERVLYPATPGRPGAFWMTIYDRDDVAMGTLSPLPPPGSDAALALGCACGVLDNAHGNGIDGRFVMSAGCPLHGGGQ